ncbi:MAG: phosphatase PAP2 family protein [Coriobacteriia bacterium]|nr:phosphatase PAP2 family protein [Coriobacteriia bacterium]
MDIDFLLALQSFRQATGGVLDTAVRLFSDGGAVLFMAVVPLVIYLALDKNTGLFMGVCITFSSIVGQAVKNIACVYRPWIRSSDLQPVASALSNATGYSFPSLHCTTTGSCVTSFWARWHSKVWIAVGILLMLGMMFSRMYLGVHTPQDVVAGMLLGVITVPFTAHVVRWVYAKDHRDYLLLGANVVFMAAFLAFFSLKGYPTDYVNGALVVDPYPMVTDCYRTVGLYLGILTIWTLDRHWIHYDVKRPWKIRVARCLLGLAAAGVCLTALTAALTALLGAWWGHLIGYYAGIVAALGLVPALFMTYERRTGRFAQSQE